ncbi:hypothetical protein EBL23_11055 [Enterococcus faecium]|nr:hypothetical protein [Enterococcus faecium]
MNKRLKFLLVTVILFLLPALGAFANSHEETFAEPPVPVKSTSENTLSVSGISSYEIETSKEFIEPLPIMPRNLATSSDAFIPSDIKEEIENRSIIGVDNRTRVTNTTAHPNAAIGQTVTTWPNGTRSNGTAWMYGNKVAVTAGHVIYNRNRGGWARQVAFYPGKNGSSNPLGVYYASQLYTDTKYVASHAYTHDWGMLRFTTNVGALTGYFGAEWTSASQNGISVAVRGYPGEKSGQLWTASGPIIGHQGHAKTHYTIDTTGGQSGSPVYRPSTNRAVAIHTHGVTTSGNYNRGQRIDSSLFNIITNARSW